MASPSPADDPFEVELERVVRRLRSSTSVPVEVRQRVVAALTEMTGSPFVGLLDDAAPALLADVLLAVSFDEVETATRRAPGTGQQLAEIRRAL